MLKQSYLKCSKNSQITILLLTGEEKIYSEQNKILKLSSVLAFKFYAHLHLEFCDVIWWLLLAVFTLATDYPPQTKHPSNNSRQTDNPS